MKCPICGGETKKGEAAASGTTPFAASVWWYPEEEMGKIFKDDIIGFKRKGVGYYCEKCHKLFAVFDAG